MWEPKSLPGKVTIICENVRMEVTSNLHAALKALRHSKETQTFWIDAVCINQGDDHEKGTQIPLMKHIYGKAERVILWLGPSDRMTGSAFDKFKLLAILWAFRAANGAKEECSKEEFERFVIQDISELDDKTIFDLPDKQMWMSGPSAVQRGAMEYCDLSPVNDLRGSKAFEFERVQLWQAVDDIFANPFFSRAWIIQEVSVARTAHIQCGRSWVTWEIFRSAYNARQLLQLCEPAKYNDPSATSLAVSTVRDARKRFWNDEFCTDLAGAMTLFSFSKAKDPRDYIYAALGLIKHSSRPNRIVPDYTKDVSEVYLEAASHMILERKDLYLWGLNDPPGTKTVPNLPTWVPDWSMESEAGDLSQCRLLFSIAFPGDFVIDGRRLRVNAHLLDTICLVTDIVDDDEPRELIKENLSQFMPPSMSNEALFVTKAGYFGRCPKGVAKIGHHVAIIGGAFRPYLLEKQPEDFYHFVSYAYVEGLMEMRALGPDMTLTRIEIR
ncbi:hypothetical protein H2202_001172 [Exophiala xenobiotica]|nr:hypothetical protein H2202_001172 [Exophiala xenobiotica]